MPPYPVSAYQLPTPSPRQRGVRWEEWPQIFNPPQSMFAPGEPLHPVQQEEVRSLDFPVGVNQVIRPRFPETYTFAELKAFANVELIRLAIETRKDQIERLDWQVRPRAALDSAGRPKSTRKDSQERIKSAEKFFSKPNQWEDFHTWLRIVVEDLLVLDAPAFELQRTRGGDLAALQHVPGDTLKVLVDHNGRRPMPPAPAYQQIIKGRVWANLTDDDIVYAPRNPRAGKLYGFCFSPDTEILTRNGWVGIDKVCWHDELATRHPETHEFQWQKPIALSGRPYSGDLIHFTGKGIDVLVTPEHNMIVKHRRHRLPADTPTGKVGRPFGGSGGERLMPASELAESLSVGKQHWLSRWLIPLTADSWKGEAIGRIQFGTKVATVVNAIGNNFSYVDGRYASGSVDLSGDDYCAFMGMYLSEGSTNKGKIVIVSQIRESKHFDKFHRVLTRCFGLAAHDGREFHIYRKSLVDHVSQFGFSHEKFVPPEIMNATARQISIFLDYLIDGDGTRYPNGRIHYYTTSKRMADQVQELAQKIGRSAAISVVPPRGSVMADGREIKAENCRLQYVVRIGVLKFVGPKAKKVPFSGHVYCVSVPNKSIFVRRSGKAIWTSNSPVEQCIVTINTVMRRQASQLAYFSDGTVPAGMATVPDGWTVDQTKDWQEWMDSVFSGNLAERRKLLWAPAGSKYQAFKEAPIKDDFDEWLARIICYCFSLPPTPFIRQMNRSTAQSDTERALEEGLAPLLVWAKRIADNILWNELDFRDLEFSWGESKEVDIEARAKVNDTYIRVGVLTINEVRDSMGLEPIQDGDTPLIYTNQGAQTIEMILSQPDPLEIAAAKAPAAKPPSAPTAAKMAVDDRIREMAEIAGGIEALRIPLLRTLKRCEYVQHAGM